MPYKDMRDYLATLDKLGKLHHVKTEVDKDWEIAAVCRKLFQSIPTAKRPAIIFDNVKGSSVPVVAGMLGASPEVYALALETTPDKILDKWTHALQNPIQPVKVTEAPCQEVIHLGDAVDLYQIPVPIWTVEHDPAPFFTSPCVITVDPESGVGNVGTYRMQIKGKNRTGIGGFHIDGVQHFAIHLRKYKALGKKMPVAVVNGADPSIPLTSVTRVPYELDELAVAGGLRGEAVPVVACKTVPLVVPATAEYVLEGWIDPEKLEFEGPFGEYPGYMGATDDTVVFEISCITHRKNPLYHAFISQMPPSESSCIRGTGRSLATYRHLKHTLRLPVTDVYFTESGGATAYQIISMKKDYETQPLQVMWGAWSVNPDLAKYTIVVDDDIDIRDSFQVEWAVSFRSQPAKDIYIQRDTLAINLDPGQAPPEVPSNHRDRLISSKVGIDATCKFGFPPKAIPPKEHLDVVERNWAKYGF